MIDVKPGSIDDVNAVGHRRIGGPGWGNWYSAGTESRMGRLYAQEIEKSAPLIADPAVSGYVDGIGQKIVRNSDCQQPFTIKVIDSDQINAFALPGGFLFVNSGLILKAGDEAELAGVMAHEIAHVCAHHAMREMTRLGYTQLGAIPLIMVGGWAGCGLSAASGIALPAAFMQYSRAFEEQADYLGVQYLYRAGYDPRAYISFFERVQALEKQNPGAVAKVFAGHPQTPGRILRTRQEIVRILPPRAKYTTATPEFTAIQARIRARIEAQVRARSEAQGKARSEAQVKVQSEAQSEAQIKARQVNLENQRRPESLTGSSAGSSNSSKGLTGSGERSSGSPAGLTGSAAGSSGSEAGKQPSPPRPEGQK
jgi:predicted Zn-dependent protease